MQESIEQLFKYKGLTVFKRDLNYDLVKIIKGHDYHRLVSIAETELWINPEGEVERILNKFEIMSKEKDTPCIAIIVSDNIHRCRDFLSFNRLNPNCFKMIDDVHKLHGLSKSIPVIIMAGNGSDRFREIEQFVVNRFISVRYMDY